MLMIIQGLFQAIYKKNTNNSISIVKNELQRCHKSEQLMTQYERHSQIDFFSLRHKLQVKKTLQ